MKDYRKFVITAAALVFAFILALLKLLTPDFALVASIGVGAFSAANAMEHKYAQPKAPAA